jgi:hypothetical protein
MNFNKLPKEKRFQLIGVGLLTLLVLGGLGFGLIRWQYGHLRSLADQQEVAEKKLTRIKDAIQRADQIEAEYQVKSRRLAEREEGMAAGGDLFSWLVNAIRTFKLPYKVDLPSISQPNTPGAVNLLPNFPYQQVTTKVGGTAYYHDFGRFIADFENHFPHIRVVNLTLEPASSVGSVEKEKLAFNLDVVTLVKPSTP